MSIHQPAPAVHAEIQQQEAHKRAMARKRARGQLRSRTPDAIAGRTHVDVQTGKYLFLRYTNAHSGYLHEKMEVSKWIHLLPELYLEELSDHIEANNVDCQTDAFLDKPPTPLFVPAKTGKDVATQIEDGEVCESGHPGPDYRVAG